MYQKIRMGIGSDDNSKSKRLDRNASLKTIVQKKLLLRLATACILISIVLASIVFFREFHRYGHLVSNRAGEITARFNDEIRDLLDDPALIEKTALRNKLKMLSIIGNLIREIVPGETVDEDASLDTALYQMIVGRFQSLLVTRDSKVIGILRLTDVYDEISEKLREVSTRKPGNE